MKPYHASAISNEVRERIVVRSTNWIGDAVMTLPTVQRLREAHPNAHLAIVCHAKLQELWRHNPFVNEVITCETQPQPRQLRAGRFGLAVILPNSFRAAWEAWRAGIPRRVGFAGHNRRWLLTDIVLESKSEQPEYRSLEVAGKKFTAKRYPSIRHQAHRYLDIVSYLGGNRDFVQPKIWLEPGALPSLTKFLHEGTRPFCGINAGAEFGPAKRWLPERFAEAAVRITDEYPCRWLIFGGKGDTGIADAIEKRLREQLRGERDVVNVAGKTTLIELCELLKFCKLLLTNDTGPMHLAYALGTPLVAVFGSTSPELTGPLGPHCAVVQAQVACNPCFLRECPIDFRCMTAITTDHVVHAAFKLLGIARPPLPVPANQ